MSTSTVLPAALDSSRWYGADGAAGVLSTVLDLARDDDVPGAVLAAQQAAGTFTGLGGAVIGAWSSDADPDRFHAVVATAADPLTDATVVARRSSDLLVAPLASATDVGVEDSFGPAGLGLLGFHLRSAAWRREPVPGRLAIAGEAAAAASVFGLVDRFADEVRRLRGTRYLEEQGPTAFRTDLESALGRYRSASGVLDELLGAAAEMLDDPVTADADASALAADLSRSVRAELAPQVSEMFEVLGARSTTRSRGLDAVWRSLVIVQRLWPAA